MNSIGVEKNSEEAIKYFLDAVRLGLTLACNDVAICYYDGIGVQKDLKKAIEWFEKGALNGHALPCKNLAQIYFQERNYDLAETWMLKAISLGYNDKNNFLEKIRAQKN